MMTSGRAPRCLGILGGMGPEATVLLMSRIVAATSAQDDCDHIPMIVDNNTQVPSRIAALIDGAGEDPGPVLADMARKLEAYGAEALIMPCNTAHNYADVIRGAAGIPLIHMIDETVVAIQSQVPRVRRLGILASPATRITGVFDRAFAPTSIALVWPDDEAAVLETIRYIKSNGPDAAAKVKLQSTADELIGLDVDALLIGCTEFSLLTRELNAPVSIVDTLDILVERAVRFAVVSG